MGQTVFKPEGDRHVVITYGKRPEHRERTKRKRRPDKAPLLAGLVLLALLIAAVVTLLRQAPEAEPVMRVGRLETVAVQLEKISASEQTPRSAPAEPEPEEEKPSSGEQPEDGEESIEEEPPEAEETFLWPVFGVITSPFGHREISIGSSEHQGVDIGAPGGEPISASKSGVVTYSGECGGYGNLVIVDHGDGTQTYYAHCSVLLVQAGQTVAQGQTVALVGSTGVSTGDHCHFEVRVNGEPIDPLTVLPSQP